MPQAIVVRFPPHTVSQPGQFAGAWIRTAVPPGGQVRLSFSFRDNYVGPTRGFHVLQARINSESVWEMDVAGGSLAEQPVIVDVSRLVVGQPEVTVTLGVWERKGVTNFPLKATFSEVSLLGSEGQQVALTRSRPTEYTPLPPEVPVPAADPNLDWTLTASIVQPWRESQWIAVAQADQWQLDWPRSTVSTPSP